MCEWTCRQLEGRDQPVVCVYIWHNLQNQSRNRRYNDLFSVTMAKSAKPFPVLPMLLYEPPVLGDIQIVLLYFDTFVHELTNCF
jgi:hypothetical protein